MPGRAVHGICLSLRRLVQRRSASTSGLEGVYRNISIPGTGIWDRQRIGGPPLQAPTPQIRFESEHGVPPPSPVLPSTRKPSETATEIRSTNTELGSVQADGKRAYHSGRRTCRELGFVSNPHRKREISTEHCKSGNKLANRMFRERRPPQWRSPSALFNGCPRILDRAGGIL